MAGIIKVNQYQDFDGNTLFTSDGNGNLTTVKTNYPAFEAKLSVQQAVGTNAARNKINFDEEVFDTDNCYDHTTNYRFTPNVAGKYLCHLSVRSGENNGSALKECSSQIRFNGASGIYENFLDLTSTAGKSFTPTLVTILEFNGTTDYIEAYAWYESTAFTGGGTENFSETGTFFGAYRIGS